jgi:hypothetical protein
MTFDLKGKIIVWFIIVLIPIVIGLIWWAVNDLHRDLEGIPKLFDKVGDGINWRRL